MTSPLSCGTDAPRPAPARPEALVTGPTYRFTVLTSRLIRMEYSPTGVFTDASTQLVVSRHLDDPGSRPGRESRGPAGRPGRGLGGPADQPGSKPAHQSEGAPGGTPSSQPAAFRVVTGPDRVEVITDHLHLTHVPSLGFTRSGLNVRLRQASAAPHGGAWYHGDTWDPEETFPTNLGGTTRTLDEVDGRTALEPGLLSLTGITVLDDSTSLLVTQDEWVTPREPGGRAQDGAQDLYVFGYGQDYRAALTDFFRLTGPSPLIPRALLGNWWSRYHPYSAEEYLALMDRFAAQDLPFSVAVIDMDWHLVDIDPTVGTGWTGYTWNRDLFPDPPAFLGALHERGMLVSLNVHPAQGVRRHEEAYEAVCADLGLDPALGEDVPFDVADRDFMGSYLRRLHHPLEEQGVDFWWLDWQQGGTTTLPGLDPLWMLNHVHYLDSGRQRGPRAGAAEGGSKRAASQAAGSPAGTDAPATASPTIPDTASPTTPGNRAATSRQRRPVTFSRFADASSHRTPVGFSGDTLITWDSLRFQPEFTATAANIGYYWWSNDIGGHMLGHRDDAMVARWVQLGCFSPVNRLHSTSSEFGSKEPWRFSRDARATMEAYLRLRHRLVPYLYTWARRSASEGLGPVRPLYHDHPRQPGAYEHRRTFLFGNLVVVPFTSPLDRATGLGRETVWLPDGVWYDLPTGRRYMVGEAAGRAASNHPEPGWATGSPSTSRAAAAETGSTRSSAAVGAAATGTVPEGPGRTLTLSRPLERTGVLARAGSVIPLAGSLAEAAGDNPRELELVVVPGADGRFVLEEDDGSASPGPEAVARTVIELGWPDGQGASSQAVLRIRLEGAPGVVPATRHLRVRLLAGSCSTALLHLPGRAGDPLGLPATWVEADGFTLGAGTMVDLGELSTRQLAEGVELVLADAAETPAPWREEVYALLEPAQIPYLAKDQAWAAVQRGLSGPALLAEMEALGLPEALRSAVAEVG